MNDPLILLTNDDGWESPGLLEMKRALDGVGRVAVLAPDVNRSGVARSITTHGALAVEEIRLADGTHGRTTSGTPVDCVRLAALGVVGGPPDVVVSGVNMGANLGDDVLYSGTVAAALEGSLLGIPSIAVSQDPLEPVDTQDPERFDFRTVAAFAARLVPVMLADPQMQGMLLSVNGPGVPPDGVRGVRLTHMGRRLYENALVEAGVEGSRTRYTIRQSSEPEEDEGSDLWAVARGEISVTPLRLQLTDLGALDVLRGLRLEDLLPGTGASPAA